MKVSEIGIAITGGRSWLDARKIKRSCRAPRAANYASLDELLADPSVHSVHVNTPNRLHLPHQHLGGSGQVNQPVALQIVGRGLQPLWSHAAGCFSCLLLPRLVIVADMGTKALDIADKVFFALGEARRCPGFHIKPQNRLVLAHPQVAAPLPGI